VVPVFRDNPDQNRFELSIPGGALAVAYYRLDGSVLVLTHTEVPFEYAGLGYGTKLADGVFAVLSGRGQKVGCAFMAAYAAKHDEYRHLVC